MRLAALLCLTLTQIAFGDLFVSGFSSGVVYRYSETTGQPIDGGVFANTGLSLPHGVMRLADGTFIVASAGNDRVQRYSANGELLGAFIQNGANDLPAGTILGHLPGMENAPPIALTGRVWVQCDAREHEISPGDPLTTAEQAGHAMKATDLPRAQGAMIGKAMTALPAGKTGLVLVLINLQ